MYVFLYALPCLYLFSMQGLAFLHVVNQIWNDRSVSDEDLKTKFNSECEKWVLLLLQLIDITGSQAKTHLHVFIRGEGVAKSYRGIIKKTVSVSCENWNFDWILMCHFLCVGSCYDSKQFCKITNTDVFSTV